MSTPLEFHPLVEDDTGGAHDWYEARRPGLGATFLDAVEAGLGAIRRNPVGYGFAHDDVRAAVLTRFPYAVYYRVLPDRVRVLAVYHTSRDPAGWQSRS